MVNSFQVLTGCPATEVIRSPDLSPATAAGAGTRSVQGSLTSDVVHRETVWLTGPRVLLGSWVVRPTARATSTSSTAAMTKCIVDPAASTITRCQVGFR